MRESAALQPSTKRVVGSGGAILAGIAVFLFVAFGLRARLPPPVLRPITRDEALAALQRERAVATALGMTLVEEGEEAVVLADGFGVWRRPVSVGARECVAVLVTAFGHQSPRALALQDASSDASRITTSPVPPVSAVRGVDGLVAQVQWCDEEARARTAVAETRPTDGRAVDPLTDGTLHFAIYRGPWESAGGIEGLRRGQFSTEGLTGLGANVAMRSARSARPADAVALGPDVDLTLAGARLLPANDATYRRLIDAVRGGADATPNPRLDAYIPANDRWGLGLPPNLRLLSAALRAGAPPPPVSDPVLAAEGGTHHRVLIVLDRARLGAACATLVFTRLVPGQRATVFRHDAAALPGVALDSVANAATDRACAPGIAVYAVPDTDAATYRLSILGDAAAGATAGTVSATDEPPPPPSSRASGHRASRHGHAHGPTRNERAPRTRRPRRRSR